MVRKAGSGDNLLPADSGSGGKLSHESPIKLLHPVACCQEPEETQKGHPRDNPTWVSSVSLLC